MRYKPYFARQVGQNRAKALFCPILGQNRAIRPILPDKSAKTGLYSPILPAFADKTGLFALFCPQAAKIGYFFMPRADAIPYSPHPLRGVW